MGTAKCLKCSSMFPSDNPDDIAGDGYCPPCYEVKVAIAKAIDERLGPARSERSRPPLPYTERVVDGIVIKNYNSRPEDCIPGTNYLRNI